MDVLTELLLSDNINYTETVFLSERGVDSLQFVSQNVDAVAIILMIIYYRRKVHEFFYSQCTNLKQEKFCAR